MKPRLSNLIIGIFAMAIANHRILFLDAIPKEFFEDGWKYNICF